MSCADEKLSTLQPLHYNYFKANLVKTVVTILSSEFSIIIV